MKIITKRVRIIDGRQPVISTYIFGIRFIGCLVKIGIRRHCPFWVKNSNELILQVYKEVIFPKYVPNEKWALEYPKTELGAIGYYIMYQTGISRIVNPIRKRIYLYFARKRYFKNMVISGLKARSY